MRVEDIDDIKFGIIFVNNRVFNLDLSEDDFYDKVIGKFVECKYDISSNSFTIKFPSSIINETAEIRYRITDNFMNFYKKGNLIKAYKNITFDFNELYEKEVFKINKKSVEDIFETFIYSLEG